MDFILNNIVDNIKRVRDAIGEAALQSGRGPDDIMLVAASKTKPADYIKQAVAAGVDAVGENRVQEMLEKHTQGAYNGAPLHFIGHLQSNKVSKIVGVCDLIESVSSKALIESIGRKAVSLKIVQNVLIEVNIGREPQKSGVLPEHVEEIFELASRTDGIKVLGLMSIPPFFEENERNCFYFDTMFKLFVDMREKKYDNVSVRLLSMGMSDTYTDAIRAGSNMVRVGSALFGQRN
ncbi:MAG: YggS family pyridoxal phosphate-dependent enzyme [Oscillospiraceae bacterium]|jgi:pyridoxal phosphate enzyme (YggS family)|nr:YggS family pyridoxal phosphate-dependent enzyme [Oscillospiraceae bacterium]